jgi:hypothetical protein
LVTVKQPLPLPQGVSNMAVGGAVPTAAYQKNMTLNIRGSRANSGSVEIFSVEDAAVEEEVEKAPVKEEPKALPAATSATVP